MEIRVFQGWSAIRALLRNSGDDVRRRWSQPDKLCELWVLVLWAIGGYQESCLVGSGSSEVELVILAAQDYCRDRFCEMRCSFTIPNRRSAGSSRLDGNVI